MGKKIKEEIFQLVKEYYQEQKNKMEPGSLTVD